MSFFTDILKSSFVNAISNVTETQRYEEKYKKLSDKELVDKLKGGSEASRLAAEAVLKSRGYR
jgi:hypothetical protein